jgi:uncharacterized protein YeaO (DUF488 family)
MEINIARVYDLQPDTPGYRVLVDRLWPRGRTKESLRLDEWCKDIAPSHELRKWFHNGGSDWADFRSRYLAELQSKPNLIEHLRSVALTQPLLLLYAAKDAEQNQAALIREVLLAAD